MTNFAMVRVLVRIARALEARNEIEQDRLKRDYPPLNAGPEGPPKLRISHPTIEQLNERRQERLEKASKR